MIQLSPRQRECLAGAARGDTDAEIAAHLGLSRHTVRIHMDHVRAALDARNRAHAVHLAHKAGLLECGNGHGEGA